MMKVGNRIKLNQREYNALVEALRRTTRFSEEYRTHGHSLTTMWCGLGSATHYKAAQLAGFMEPVHGSIHKGAMGWWKLTERGSRVICYWLGQGFSYLDIEDEGRNDPGYELPLDVM